MRNTNSSVDTVNAAATAIVSAESRVQQAVQKRRWGSCWSLYWCFGFQKNNKRIGHAVLVSEPLASRVLVSTVQNSSASTSIVLPFIAPPSSPASFLQSDPPSVAQSPAGLLSLTVNSYCSSGPSSVFAIGPYAHETQPVTPPIFSAFTTEPSTAPFTPPPESVHVTTTPSSPEVPFAELLTSSLEHARRNNSGRNQKFSLSHYEFQPYQVYPGSPCGNVISPGSVISNSGTSSPYPVKCPIVGFRTGEPPKFLGFEHFTTRKWGSRFGSGSITPVGQGSGLGSGALTPDGGGLGSRLGSGAATPNGVGISRLRSGTLTPDSAWPHPLDYSPPENQISEVASLANSDHGSSRHEVTVHQRVSFELTGEDVAYFLESKLNRTGLDSSGNREIDNSQTVTDETSQGRHQTSCLGETSGHTPEKDRGKTEIGQNQQLRSFSVGSSKEFNFDSRKEEILDKPAVRSEWWANEKVAGKGDSPENNNWSFFHGS